MGAPDAVVAGGGPAGLAAALALARAGAGVVLVERDGLDRSVAPEQAFGLERRGIAHYDAPHAFLPRGAKLLRERVPEVYGELLELGAFELEIARLQPDVRPEDTELVLFCARRPLIEWGLREAVLREPLVEVVSERVENLLVSNGAVVGVETSGGERRAPLVVDAMGRTSRAPRWLAEAGIEVTEESHEVGVVYYSRYYQLHPGVEFPASKHPYGPRVDLGYALCATFLGDNGTFAFALMVPAWDSELKTLRDPNRHHACLAALPEMRDWVDPSLSRPITDVSSMGALRTTWRSYDKLDLGGFIPVADSFCHTDPTFALGLSLGLAHGFALRDCYSRGDLAGYWDETTPELRERFELARDVSGVRLARLRGEEASPSAAASTFVALNAAAQGDPDLFRTAFRRAGFLDRLGPVDQPLPAPPPAPPPPLSRQELIAAFISI